MINKSTKLTKHAKNGKNTEIAKIILKIENIKHSKPKWIS